MTKLEHPFSRHCYEFGADGLVVVSDGVRQGRFQPSGRWVSGQIMTADPLLCLWIAQKGRHAAPTQAGQTSFAKVEAP